MSHGRKGHEVRSYDYVNHPYDEVRAALRDDPETIFRNATKAASHRAESVASELRVNVAGLEVGAEIVITVGDVVDEEATSASPARTVMQIAWKAAAKPRLFPLMEAELSIYSLTASETQLDFHGTYEPPLGLVGDAMNSVIGHRLAEASVHRFVSDVGAYLRSSLGPG